MVTRLSLVLALALLVVCRSARADDVPRVHHAPPSVAPANAALEIGVTFDAPDRIARAVLLYRRAASPNATPAEIPFLRASRGGAAAYVATIPAADMVTPVVAYAIELDTTGGERFAAFASRASMHAVTLTEEAGDERERLLLARLGGRRVQVSASGDYVHFGTSPATLADGTTTTVRDQYYRAEGRITYRFLRTVAEFGLRAGVVRGSSAVRAASDPSQFDVGLNYGAPRIRLRATDWLHVEGEFLSSVTEVGYAVGGSGAVLFGDPYATHLAVGLEGIEVFGIRGYTRLDVTVTRRLTAATLVEVTNMPHAADAGVRLATELRLDVGAGFGLGVRGGYQARSFASGGAGAGLTASYAF
jgi:hypothetical protein